MFCQTLLTLCLIGCGAKCSEVVGHFLPFLLLENSSESRSYDYSRTQSPLVPIA